MTRELRDKLLWEMNRDLKKMLGMYKGLHAFFYALRVDTSSNAAWELVFQMKADTKQSTQIRLIIEDINPLFDNKKLGLDIDSGIDCEKFGPLTLARLRLCKIAFNALSYIKKNVYLATVPASKEVRCRIGRTWLDYEITTKERE